MVEMTLFALLGGFLLALNRILISRLGMSIGAFRSSWWNHVVGFVLLVPIVLLVLAPRTTALSDAPWWAYMGGAIGALFVALSSIVIPRIGATTALALMITGQMTISTLIDFRLGKIDSPEIALLGLALIIAGAFIPKARRVIQEDTR
ncbi:MAG: DMT family transporter [Xanthomonadales bacterium]|nr:DMT family transporter [Xanthomonadales bacterium]